MRDVSLCSVLLANVLNVGAIPPPNGAIITYVQQNIAIARKCSLSYGFHAFRMHQSAGPYCVRIHYIQIPHKHFTRGIAHSHISASVVQWEANEPQFTFRVLECVQNGSRCFARFQFGVVNATGLPTDDFIFACLQCERIENTFKMIRMFQFVIYFAWLMEHAPLIEQNLPAT